LVNAIVEALRSAGAREEMIAAAIKAGGELGNSTKPRGGRPRKHADDTARKRAWKKGVTKRVTKLVAGDETGDETPLRPVGGDETPAPRNENRDEISRIVVLRACLEGVAAGHFDPAADVEPIRALLDQGCDLEADILPTVARTVPELPRPLKKWGAPWLVRDILAAREQRLAGHRVEDPPPPRHTPAIEWDEFVGGYRAGLIKWNTARLGPKPGEPGCCAPAEVLREHGFRP
jgi:hypothetical protein